MPWNKCQRCVDDVGQVYVCIVGTEVFAGAQGEARCDEGVVYLSSHPVSEQHRRHTQPTRDSPIPYPVLPLWPRTRLATAGQINCSPRASTVALPAARSPG